MCTYGVSRNYLLQSGSLLCYKTTVLKSGVRKWQQQVYTSSKGRVNELDGVYNNFPAFTFHKHS